MASFKENAKKILSYFVQGSLYIAPIGILIYALVTCCMFIIRITNKWSEVLFGLEVPGLGLLIFIVFIILVGILGKTILAQPFRFLFNLLLEKIPLLRTFYNALQDFFSAFMGKEKKFHNPVLVKIYAQSEIEMIGFITQNDLNKLGIADSGKVSVYFPYAFSFMGTVMIVPQKDITPLKISSAEALKFIVSGGIIDVNEFNEKNKTDEENKPEE